MNCPNCGGNMIRGRINTKAVLHVMPYPASIIFEPDDYFDKKKVSSPMAKWEGWYCAECKKIVGIFETK